MGESIEVNRFDAFLDKISNVVFEIISNESNEIFEDFFWGIMPKGLRVWEFSDEDRWIKEQEKIFDDFIDSLSPKQYREYYEEQDEIRKVMWELDLAS